MRTYSFYTMGKFNGKGPTLVMFRYIRPDGDFGSCECVEEQNVSAHITALHNIGYRPATNA